MDLICPLPRTNLGWSLLLLIWFGPIVIPVALVGFVIFLMRSINTAVAVATHGRCAGRPLGLFARVLLTPLFLYSATLVLFWYLLDGENDYLLVGVAAHAIINAILFLLLLWFYTEQLETTDASNSFAPTRSTIWLQDLMIMLFYIGAGQSFLWYLLIPVWKGIDAALPVIAIVLFVCAMLSIKLSAELCQSSPLAQTGAERAIVLTLLLIVMPFDFPPLCFAWLMWKIARHHVRQLHPGAPLCINQKHPGMTSRP